jgi:hypothetical protein
MKRNWDKVAKQQFDAMPDDFKDDWADFRDSVYRHK